MKENSTRFMIIVLTLFTAFVHLALLGFGGDHVEVLFVLNGLGYLGLLGAVLFRFPAGQQALVHYAFMAYTLVTIIAWVIIVKAPDRDTLGYATKAVEVLLIVFLWLNLKRVQARKA